MKTEQVSEPSASSTAAVRIAPELQPQRRNSTWKFVVGAVVLALVAFFAYGAVVANSPAGQQRIAERRTIAQCRESAQRTPGAAVHEMCLRLEAEYRRKWNREP